MDLSIVIVNYNSSTLLKKCIASIVRSAPTMTYEIIVVDNNSDSFPQDELLNEARVQVLMNTENVGFGRANNQGVQKARGSYVLLLNVDTEVVDRAIDTLYSFIKAKGDKIIAGGKLLNPDKTDQPSAGPFYSLPVVFGMLFLKGDHWGLTRGAYSDTKTVDWISGACIMMKKSDFELLNGFDRKIFMYMEEIDLLYRARKKGFHVYYYPEAQFIHIGAATSGTSAQPIINIYKGLVYFYTKHYGAFEVALLKILLMIKAWMGIVIGTVTGNGQLVTTYHHARKNL